MNNGMNSEAFTEITIKATPEIIAQATATAIEADRVVWISELKPLRGRTNGKDTRFELRMILRNT